MTSSAAHESYTRALFLAAGAVALGWTLQWSNGTFGSGYQAIIRLTGALALCVAAVTLRDVKALERRGPTLLAGVLIVGIGCEVAELFARDPADALWVKDAASPIVPFFHGGILVAVALVAASVSDRPRLATLSFPLLLATYVVLGVWIIHSAPNPFIDVHVFQKNASDELLAGRNPYLMSFPNVYKNDLTPFYAPGLSVNRRLTFGFIYPPLSLLLGIPGHLLGDHRYSLLAAMTGTAALIGYTRPGRVATLAAAMLLLTPRGFYVLERGWTEPYVALGLAAVVFAAVRTPRALPFVLGLFVSIKQYLLLAAPIAWLLVARPNPPPRRRVAEMAAIVAGVALAVNMPFALWNTAAFIKNIVLLQFAQPFRSDALTYAALIVRAGGPALPAWVSFGVALAVAAIALRRFPRSPAGFAAAVAFVFFGFFAFNKQAFCNYYYFVIAALACAVGATKVQAEGDK